jgi:hypothetical protein
MWRAGKLQIGDRLAKRKERWTPFRQVSTVTRPLPGGGVLVSDVALDTVGADEVWVNNRYTVFVRRYLEAPPWGRTIHLSLKRNDKQPIHDWRELQRIKNELLGPDREAVELYPSEARKVDTSNQYHLWCFPDLKLDFGFEDRLVMDKPPALGARQRPGAGR